MGRSGYRCADNRGCSDHAAAHFSSGAAIQLSTSQLDRSGAEAGAGTAFRVLGLHSCGALHVPAAGGEISHAVLDSHSLELAWLRRLRLSRSGRAYAGLRRFRAISSHAQDDTFRSIFRPAVGCLSDSGICDHAGASDGRTFLPWISLSGAGAQDGCGLGDLSDGFTVWLDALPAIPVVVGRADYCSV